MKTTHKILVADRNPHIRNFLKRELTASGVRVQLAENSQELLDCICGRRPISLLVLDPDFPGIDTFELGKKLSNRIPQLPVVLHCVPGEDNFFDLGKKEMIRIEKNGNSIELLKRIIRDMLARCDFLA